jgi:hypothetical protein
MISTILDILVSTLLSGAVESTDSVNSLPTPPQFPK